VIVKMGPRSEILNQPSSPKKMHKFRSPPTTSHQVNIEWVQLWFFFDSLR
jgi:hypothetical protein